MVAVGYGGGRFVATRSRYVYVCSTRYMIYTFVTAPLVVHLFRLRIRDSLFTFTVTYVHVALRLPPHPHATTGAFGGGFTVTRTATASTAIHTHVTRTWTHLLLRTPFTHHLCHLHPCGCLRLFTRIYTTTLHHTLHTPHLHDLLRYPSPPRWDGDLPAFPFTVDFPTPLFVEPDCYDVTYTVGYLRYVSFYTYVVLPDPYHR